MTVVVPPPYLQWSTSLPHWCLVTASSRPRPSITPGWSWPSTRACSGAFSPALRLSRAEVGATPRRERKAGAAPSPGGRSRRGSRGK